MLELTKENFENEVLNDDSIVLVDYWSPHCESCKRLIPIIEGYYNTYGNKLKFTSIDTSKARRLAIGQKIIGLPVVAIYKDGQKIDCVVGDDVTANSVEQMICNHI